MTRTLELDSIFKMHSELYNVRGKVHCRHGFIHSFGGWLGGPIQYVHAVVGYLGQLQLDNNTS